MTPEIVTGTDPDPGLQDETEMMNSNGIDQILEIQEKIQKLEVEIGIIFSTLRVKCHRWLK